MPSERVRSAIPRNRRLGWDEEGGRLRVRSPVTWGDFSTMSARERRRLDGKASHVRRIAYRAYISQQICYP